MSNARDQLSELATRVSVVGDRLYLTKKGRRIAALVPVEDAEAMEQAEDAYLARRADEARAEQGDEPYTPLSVLMEHYSADLKTDEEAA